MSNNWYFAKDGQPMGPFTFDQLKQLTASGVVSSESPVCNEGASMWVPASSVPGLGPDRIDVPENNKAVIDARQIHGANCQPVQTPPIKQQGLGIWVYIVMFIIGTMVAKAFFTDKDPLAELRRAQEEQAKQKK